MNKIIDTDALFEKYVREYMKKNAGKFTEEEWEDKIPELYDKFGKTPLEELGGKTPAEYYSSFGGEELVEMLSACVKGGLPVSDCLCEALTASADSEKPLIKLLDDGEEELVMYALNILNDKNSVPALPRLVELILDYGACVHVKDLAAEILCDRPEEVKETILRVYNDVGDKEREYFADILSRCKPDDRIYAVLVDAFETHREALPFYATLLARYGDERALPLLYEAIEGDVNYVEFQELKFAVENLGGEYEKERDYSNDRLYKKIMKKS